MQGIEVITEGMQKMWEIINSKAAAGSSSIEERENG